MQLAQVGRRILQLGELFNQAFTKPATMEIAISGFKLLELFLSTGILSQEKILLTI